MRSNAYLHINEFRRALISAELGCVYTILVLQTPENVAFWMRSNAKIAIARKRSGMRFRLKNIYMGSDRHTFCFEFS